MLVWGLAGFFTVIGANWIAEQGFPWATFFPLVGSVWGGALVIDWMNLKQEYDLERRRERFREMLDTGQIFWRRDEEDEQA